MGVILDQVYWLFCKTHFFLVTQRYVIYQLKVRQISRKNIFYKKKSLNSYIYIYIYICTWINKNSVKLHKFSPINVALVAEYQNLNSGSLRMNGRNSSFCFVGSSRPSSSSASNCAIAGSIFGVRKARSKFK